MSQMIFGNRKLRMMAFINTYSMLEMFYIILILKYY